MKYISHKVVIPLLPFDWMLEEGDILDVDELKYTF